MFATTDSVMPDVRPPKSPKRFFSSPFSPIKQLASLPPLPPLPNLSFSPNTDDSPSSYPYATCAYSPASPPAAKSKKPSFPSYEKVSSRNNRKSHNPHPSFSSFGSVGSINGTLESALVHSYQPTSYKEPMSQGYQQTYNSDQTILGSGAQVVRRPSDALRGISGPKRPERSREVVHPFTAGFSAYDSQTSTPDESTEEVNITADHTESLSGEIVTSGGNNREEHPESSGSKKPSVSSLKSKSSQSSLAPVPTGRPYGHSYTASTAAIHHYKMAENEFDPETKVYKGSGGDGGYLVHSKSKSSLSSTTSSDSYTELKSPFKSQIKEAKDYTGTAPNRFDRQSRQEKRLTYKTDTRTKSDYSQAANTDSAYSTLSTSSTDTPGITPRTPYTPYTPIMPEHEGASSIYPQSGGLLSGTESNEHTPARPLRPQQSLGNLNNTRISTTPFDPFASSHLEHGRDRSNNRKSYHTEKTITPHNRQTYDTHKAPLDKDELRALRRTTIRPPPKVPPPSTPVVGDYPTVPFSATLLSKTSRTSPTKESECLVTLQFSYDLDFDRSRGPKDGKQDRGGASSVILPWSVLQRVPGHLTNFLRKHLDEPLEEEPPRPELTDGSSAEESELESVYGLTALLRDEYLKSMFIADTSAMSFLDAPPTPVVSAKSTVDQRNSLGGSRKRATTRNQYTQKEQYPSPSSTFTSPTLNRARTLPLNVRRKKVQLSLDPVEVDGGGVITEVKVLLSRDAGVYQYITARLLSGKLPRNLVGSKRREVREECRWLGMGVLEEELELPAPREKSMVFKGGRGYI